jgi:hypothetical protein
VPAAGVVRLAYPRDQPQPGLHAHAAAHGMPPVLCALLCVLFVSAVFLLCFWCVLVSFNLTPNPNQTLFPTLTPSRAQSSAEASMREFDQAPQEVSDAVVVVVCCR